MGQLHIVPFDSQTPNEMYQSSLLVMSTGELEISIVS